MHADMTGIEVADPKDSDKVIESRLHGVLYKLKENIIDEAKTEADRIISVAKHKADKILQEAQAAKEESVIRTNKHIDLLYKDIKVKLKKGITLLVDNLCSNISQNLFKKGILSHVRNSIYDPSFVRELLLSVVNVEQQLGFDYKEVKISCDETLVELLRPVVEELVSMKPVVIDVGLSPDDPLLSISLIGEDMSICIDSNWIINEICKKIPRQANDLLFNVLTIDELSI